MTSITIVYMSFFGQFNRLRLLKKLQSIAIDDYPMSGLDYTSMTAFCNRYFLEL